MYRNYRYDLVIWFHIGIGICNMTSELWNYAVLDWTESSL